MLIELTAGSGIYSGVDVADTGEFAISLLFGSLHFFTSADI
jgi:hypothetical protein